MNGPILGQDGAVFLAQFSANLAAQYNAQIEALGGSPDEFHPEAYSIGLTEALKAYALPDANRYGKLLGLKGALASYTEEGRLTDEQLSLIYLRDIMLLREIDVEEEGIVESILENQPSGDEI